MAVLDIGKYHTGVDWVPAIVIAEYLTSATPSAEPEKLQDHEDGDLVDLVLLGFSNGKRRAEIGTDAGEFERG